MTETIYQKELLIPSNIEGLNQCLDIVEEIKEKFSLDLNSSFSLHTVIVESVENAFIHGNKSIEELNVRVCISISANEILLEIEDCGEGFDLDSICSPIETQNIYNESGRGVFFIKMLSLKCCTVGKGNIIRIKLKR